MRDPAMPPPSTLSSLPRPRPLAHLLALVAWMTVILLLSGDLGSDDTMRRGLSWLLRPFVSPSVREPGAALSLNTVWALRKLLHLLEYALLALLAARWLRSLSRAPSTPWAPALLLAAGCAALDESHQSLVAGRTGSGWDVLVDGIGASLALLVMSARDPLPRGLRYRLVDVLGAALGLLLAWPLLLLAALLVRLTMGRPVLFRQERVGQDEHAFTLLKFRTMTADTDPHGRLLPGPARLTPTGRWLRALSIDELPQLWNVLRGDMSLVGPRPLYSRYLPYYTPRERLRHHVRPGITGYAQVNGRNSLTWDDRLELDAQYVERKSLSLDLRLLLRTVGQVLRRSDVRETALQGSLAEFRAGRATPDHDAAPAPQDR